VNEIERRTAGGLATVPTGDQVLQLLQLAAAYDRRTVGHVEKAAWCSAAEIGGWSYEEAAAVIRTHQATSREYLTPAHITTGIRSMRRRARLSEEGTRPDGGKRVTLDAAGRIWRDAFRAAGPSPNGEQVAKVTDMLSEMLLDAGDPSKVLDAAIVAGRKLSVRIDWAAEKIASGAERLGPMGLAPIEYLSDDRLDGEFAARHEDFPRQWRLYDPLPDEMRLAEREHLLPQLRVLHAEGRIPDYDRQERDLPDWLLAHVADTRYRDSYSRLEGSTMTREELAEEAARYRQTEGRATAWLAEDRKQWEQERIPVVREWYRTHPGVRPGLVEEGA
jgi:hypothetical protein